MHILKARNAHRLAPLALDYLMRHGKGASHPAGPRLQLDGPACITVERPLERVIFHSEVMSNPFYLTMRALWALAGRQDQEALAKFKPSMDAREVPPGWAWRGLFGQDQLPGIVEHIQSQPMLQVWFPTGAQREDVDRNLSACFRVNRERCLDLILYNGSSNVLDGVLEEDLTTYGTLLEFVATAAGFEIGSLSVITSCLWMPTSAMMLNMADCLGLVEDQLCPYEVQSIDPFPIMRPSPGLAPEWIKDLDVLITEGPSTMGIQEPYFRRVVAPLVAAWDTFQAGDIGPAAALCYEIQDKALSQACRNYLDAIRTAQAKKEQTR